MPNFNCSDHIQPSVLAKIHQCLDYISHSYSKYIYIPLFSKIYVLVFAVTNELVHAGGYYLTLSLIFIGFCKSVLSGESHLVYENI